MAFKWKYMSEKQLNFMTGCTSWLNLAEGAVGSGKSIGSLVAFFEVVKDSPAKEFIICAASSSTANSNIVNPLIDMYPYFCTKTTIDGQPYLLFEFPDEDEPNGLIVKKAKVVGGKNTGSDKAIRGMNAGGAIIDELTLINRDMFNEIMARCRVGENPVIISTTNPSHPLHWVKEDLIDKAKEKNINHWHFKLEDNPHLPQQFIKKLDYLSGAELRRKRDGLWEAENGVVYEDYDHEIHVIDSIPEGEILEKYIGGYDKGWVHYGTVCVIAKTWNRDRFELVPNDQGFLEKNYIYNYYVVEEIKSQYKEPLWYGNKILNAYRYYEEDFKVYGDHQASDAITIIKDLGVNIEFANKSVLDGISALGTLLKQKRLFFLRNQHDLAKDEIVVYSWKVNKHGLTMDEPDKSQDKDNMLDSIRYAIYTDFYNEINKSKVVVLPSALSI